MILVTDIETTGLNHEECGVLSIGAQLIKKVKDTWQLGAESFYQTGSIDKLTRVENQALEINGFSYDEIYEQGHSNRDMYINFLAFCKSIDCYDLAGVNFGQFDAQFLKRLHEKSVTSKWPFGHRFLDLPSVYFAVNQQVSIHDCSLLYMEKAYDIKNPNLHHALDDAITEAKILCKMLNKYSWLN
jgi:DNA polymerase III epsilon subunit-like protein